MNDARRKQEPIFKCSDHEIFCDRDEDGDVWLEIHELQSNGNPAACALLTSDEFDTLVDRLVLKKASTR